MTIIFIVTSYGAIFACRSMAALQADPLVYTLVAHRAWLVWVFADVHENLRWALASGHSVLVKWVLSFAVARLLALPFTHNLLDLG